MKNRQLALKWWEGLGKIAKADYADLWRKSLPIFSLQKDWTLPMINTSSSSIVLIYEFINSKS